jgi:hypothetical protein
MQHSNPIEDPLNIDLSLHAHITCSGACDYLRFPPLRRKRSFASHASQTQLLPPPIGKNLPDSVREFSPKTGTFHRKVYYRRPNSVRSSGPIGARESARIAGIHELHISARSHAHNSPRIYTYEIQAYLPITCIQATRIFSIIQDAIYSL